MFYAHSKKKLFLLGVASFRKSNGESLLFVLHDRTAFAAGVKLSCLVFAHNLADFLFGHPALFHRRDHGSRRGDRNTLAHSRILVAANPELATVSDHARRSRRTFVVVHRTLHDFRLGEVLALVLHGRIASSQTAFRLFHDFATPAHADWLASRRKVKFLDVFKLGHGSPSRTGVSLDCFNDDRVHVASRSVGRRKQNVAGYACSRIARDAAKRRKIH